MSSQARILVLEDDSIMLELLCEVLEGAGGRNPKKVQTEEMYCPRIERNLRC